MVLSATGTSATSISLTWKNNASNATAVLVEDSTDSVTFTQIASLGGKTTSYSSTGLTAGTLYYYRVRAQTAAGLSSYSSTGLRTGSTYYYRVRAQNGAGTPAYSNTSSATTLSAPAAPSALSATAASNSAYSNTASALTTGGSVPGAPSALVATPGSRGRIGLSWTNNSPNATASLVEDSTDNTTFTQIASLSGTATTYSGSGLKSGALYYFRVRAQNAVGTSGYSNTASATAP
jgi:phosphodiesterase/alkaline phosphatase D-like protein